MYVDSYSEKITKELSKLKKKDPQHFKKVMNKIDDIIAKPNAVYKFLHYDLKGYNRVHIGHFVLVFEIDHKQKIIMFEDYEHHDTIYEK